MDIYAGHPDLPDLEHLRTLLLLFAQYGIQHCLSRLCCWLHVDALHAPDLVNTFINVSPQKAHALQVSDQLGQVAGTCKRVTTSRLVWVSFGYAAGTPL